MARYGEDLNKLTEEIKRNLAMSLPLEAEYWMACKCHQELMIRLKKEIDGDMNYPSIYDNSLAELKSAYQISFKF